MDEALFCRLVSSDVVTISYGESWESSCEQNMSPNRDPFSPSSKDSKS